MKFLSGYKKKIVELFFYKLSKNDQWSTCNIEGLEIQGEHTKFGLLSFLRSGFLSLTQPYKTVFVKLSYT